MKLLDLVAKDMEGLKSEFSLSRLVSQQFASADSISANIEEGYGRLSKERHYWARLLPSSLQQSRRLGKN